MRHRYHDYHIRTDSDVYLDIVRAIFEEHGRGFEYQNGLIDDPAVTIARLYAAARLTAPRLKRHLDDLIRMGFVSVHKIRKKRHVKIQGRMSKRPDVTVIRITDKGREYFVENPRFDSLLCAN